MHEGQHTKKTGFTLIEIIIAAGILSMFMTGVFAIYRSGSKAFVSGSWRAEEQKRLQGFLGALSRDLSMANTGLIRIETDGTQNSVQATPMYINTNMFRLNSAPAFINTDTNAWVCLMAFSISYPFIDANATFSTPLTPGRWSGISVWAKDRKIKYVRSGDPVTYSNVPVILPGAVVEFPGPGIVGAGLDFLPDPDQNRNYTYDLSMEGFAIVATGTDLDSIAGMELICRSARYEGGTRTSADLQQSIVVNLASQTSIIPF